MDYVAMKTVKRYSGPSEKKVWNLEDRLQFQRLMLSVRLCPLAD